MLRPTHEQQEAIRDQTHDLIVTAGAGSGKTFVLVERYLHLLDCHPDWAIDQLVAITFTEKAAREMRNRVRREVERRAAAETGPSDVWRRRRLQLETARISTIHSFCAGLLRANAAEAGLDPAFAVLDETERSLLIVQIVEEELLALAESDQNPAARLLVEYESRDIHRLLVDLLAGGASVRGLLRSIPGDPGALLELWHSALEVARARALGELADDPEWQAAVERLEATTPHDPSDLLAEARRVALGALAQLQAPPAEAMRALHRLASEIALRGGRKAAWGDTDTVNEVKDALKTLRERARALDSLLGPELGPVDERAATLLPLWKRLAEAAFARFDRLKARRGALDFDDLESRTATLLAQHPTLRRRLQSEIHHLLVDEFQDTNDFQVAIIKALAGKTPGRLFIVGDGKQSIYRFRGAVVELFGSLGRSQERTLALRVNFRSHGRLVQACNHLFKALFDGDGPAQVSFEALDAHRPVPPQEAPALELVLVPSGRDAAIEEKLDAREERRWEAWALATRLRELVDEGRRVHDPATGESRPVDWGDIAILFRATTDLPLYEDVFKQQRLPFVTVAGRGFYGRQEVRDLLNLLAAVAAGDGTENLALASVLRSPLFGLSDEALLWLALHRPEGEPLSATLADPPVDRLRADDLAAARRAHQVLSNLRGLAGRVTILELLRVALRETGFLATLSGLPDGDRRRGNVEKLLEVARERGAILLSDFNRYVQDLTAHETRESEALVAAHGAVQLLTVHAAKGLEFPVVVLADASRGSGSRFGSLLLARNRGIALKIAGDDGKEAETAFYRLLKHEEAAREQAEATRLLYVGATRARDLLIVSGRTGQRGGRDWLSRLLDVLECRPIGPEEFEALQCEWGEVRVWRLQAWPSDLRSGTAPPAGSGLWPAAARDGGTPFESAPIRIPTLLGGRPRPGQPVTGQLHPVEATTLGLRAGDARAVAAYRHRVEGAPGELRPALGGKEQRRPWGWQIGEVAHRALARWQLPSTTPNLTTLLEAYAWNLGLTDRELMTQAVARATEMLQRFEDSQLYAEIRAGNRRFTEVPFTVEWQGRLINGQVDLLYERAGGYYTLVDFKAAYIPPDRSAEEYTLEQFGASLALAQRAIAGWLGTRPSVTVFFLFQGRIARLPADRLRAYLDLLAQHLANDDAGHSR